MTMPGETIRIGSASRPDALDLVRRLGGLHTHLVQLGNHTWLVCVRPDGPEDAVIPVVRVAAQAWATERHLDSTIRVGDCAYEVHGSQAPT